MAMKETEHCLLGLLAARTVSVLQNQHPNIIQLTYFLKTAPFKDFFGSHSEVKADFCQELMGSW